MLYKHLVIDHAHNQILCDPKLVGLGELVEIYAPDDDTPRQACGKTLHKIKDPNIFVPQSAYDAHEMDGSYALGERAVLKILARNNSGIRRRKSSAEEKLIVNMERNDRFKEMKVVRAKTGSVRAKKRK